jgi:hypothetical protein
VTLDQNLEYQQNIPAIKLGFLVIKVPDNKIRFYEPIFAVMCAAAERIEVGRVVHITSSAE